ncbi:tol-pal system-associated acyl-CoA thioesterase [Mesobaculum littorinae]|uniref:Tol-pal system-associated acyl-CoA thioesterase n=1 Tax=Mesobaculum littorinae TaxID=2486419 RepID=A0A438AIS3_9RHOB|nr:tol-pal system-associated acyl-CoA thioesterase [Mesobaculum littorinae]RVV98497.1 tol-pal system-associated acyl-CoA thioesterase [Mesobaculum littorinae]
MSHAFETRVFYEDTDLGGIVYHANFLKFIERARSDWVRDLGVDQMRMQREFGTVFVVRRIEADYLRPAYLDDILQVSTEVSELRPARLVLTQAVRRGDDTLFAARVTLVAMGPGGRAVRLPQVLRDLPV